VRKESDKSISEIVYDYLVEKLLTGEIRYGQILKTKDIAKELNVSNMPVRDAISKLAHQDVVEVTPRVGCQVVIPSREESLMLVEARLMVEKFAVRKYLQSPDSRSIEAIGGITEAMRDMLKNERVDKKKFMELDRRFHQELVRLSHNNYVMRMYDDIGIHMNMYFTYSVFGYDMRRKKMTEHLAIYDALAAESEEVIKLVEQHLSDLLQTLEKTEVSVKIDAPYMASRGRR
jgi:DNA-binding GntR family transcriptional regulator